MGCSLAPCFVEDKRRHLWKCLQRYVRYINAFKCQNLGLAESTALATEQLLSRATTYLKSVSSYALVACGSHIFDR